MVTPRCRRTDAGTSRARRQRIMRASEVDKNRKGRGDTLFSEDAPLRGKSRCALRTRARARACIADDCIRACGHRRCCHKVPHAIDSKCPLSLFFLILEPAVRKVQEWGLNSNHIPRVKIAGCLGTLVLPRGLIIERMRYLRCCYVDLSGVAPHQIRLSARISFPVLSIPFVIEGVAKDK